MRTRCGNEGLFCNFCDENLGSASLHFLHSSRFLFAIEPLMQIEKRAELPFKKNESLLFLVLIRGIRTEGGGTKRGRGNGRRKELMPFLQSGKKGKLGGAPTSYGRSRPTVFPFREDNKKGLRGRGGGGEGNEILSVGDASHFPPDICFPFPLSRFLFFLFSASHTCHGAW